MNAEPWRRGGRLIGPADLFGALSGAYRLTQAPVALHLSNGLIRIFLAARNAQNRAEVFSLDCDPERGMGVRRRDEAPILSPDQVPGVQSLGLGTTIALPDGRLRCYLNLLRLTPPSYSIAVFVCHSEDEGRSFSPPVEMFGTDQNEGLPVLCGTVLREGEQWTMWYAAFERLIFRGDLPPDATYGIRRAWSQDGLAWTPDPQTALGNLEERTTGVICPRVLRHGAGWEMWSSGRGKFDDVDPSSRRYRLIRALSEDGVRFCADRDACIFVNPPAEGDWDEEMQCYPDLLRHPDGRDLLFYCGNDYGAAGIGWASRPTPRL